VGSDSTFRALSSTLRLVTPAGEQVRVSDSGNSTLDYVQISGGSSPFIATGGASANSSLSISSRGTGTVFFRTNGVNQVQMQVTHTASAVNFVQVTGNSTGNAPRILSQGSDSNIGLVIAPKGTGSLQTTATDSAVAGGNARGSNAVDLQISRTAATQVASGSQAVIGGGAGNTVSAQNSVVAGGGSNAVSGIYSGIVGGFVNTITGSYAAIPGGYLNTADSSASIVLGGTRGRTRGIVGIQISSACDAPVGGGAVGVSQAALLILARDTTDATASILTSTGTVAGTTNQIILPNNSAYYFRGELVAGVTGGGNTKGWYIEGVIKRGANAASTALVGTPTVTSLYADAGAATWTVTATADTTNGGLAITATGQASTSIRWVAQIRTTEMTY